MLKKMLPCLIATGLLAGCAASPQASTEPTAERGETVTGSNIPRKSKSAGTNNVETMSKEDVDRARTR